MLARCLSALIVAGEVVHRFGVIAFNAATSSLTPGKVHTPQSKPFITTASSPLVLVLVLRLPKDGRKIVLRMSYINNEKLEIEVDGASN
ncbi:hypothetical protein V2J09_004384 [Rumex salicifolius]